MAKVVHLQYSINSERIAAYRLHKAFLNANIESGIVCLHSDVGDKLTVHLRKRGEIRSLLNNKIQSYITRKTIKKYGLFSYPVIGTNISKLPPIKNADIIYIHWVLHGFLSLKNIEQLIRLGKPVVFFMHDMWTITGGCHYSFECNKYQARCNNCQMFPGQKINDWSASGFDKKLKLFSAYNNIFYVAPSKWLYSCAKQSALLKNKQIFYIPNVLDSTLFKPFDKRIAKEILNIDAEETVIVFGAVSVMDPYKGWSYLQQALEILKNDSSSKILVLIFGSLYNKEIADFIPFKTKFMGYLNDEYSTSLVYNAADVFVAPSLADNLPSTIFEALSCGTPVVAFDTGGIPDLIMHKINGYLSRYKDSADIAEGIKFCLNNKLKGHTPADFNTTATVKKHLELFDHIRSISL